MRYYLVYGDFWCVLLDQFEESIALPLQDKDVISQLRDLEIITERGLLRDLLELRERVYYSLRHRDLIIIELDVPTYHGFTIIHFDMITHFGHETIRDMRVLAALLSLLGSDDFVQVIPFSFDLGSVFCQGDRIHSV